MCLRIVRASSLLHRLGSSSTTSRPTIPTRSLVAKDFKFHTTTTFKMPERFIITVKEGADVNATKEKARAQGGTIVQEYTIIPGFVVEFPDGFVHSFADDPDVQSCEKDGIVTTQQ
ncbi:hypothetical protein TWF696_006876 [Orbilia brochopaga]|uniref:Inhibitor I9 domain-containing protein n=1 Tax=Orbilia brochopaga TaxID=3140254 RepID=A0AAV9UQ29_9PEZI